MVRDALQSLHHGLATIYEAKKTKKKNITFDNELTKVAEDIPCHLSYKLIYASNQTETVATTNQQAVLFMDSDIVVKEGSEIVVKQCDRVLHFVCSGIPSVYGSHQEIPLSPKEVRA